MSKSKKTEETSVVSEATLTFEEVAKATRDAHLKANPKAQKITEAACKSAIVEAPVQEEEESGGNVEKDSQKPWEK